MKEGMVQRNNRFLFGVTFLATLILCNSSCRKDLDIGSSFNNGVAVKLPYLWRAGLNKPDSILLEVLTTPIIYDTDKILIGSSLNNHSALFALDSKDGTILWKWSDLLSRIYYNSSIDNIKITDEGVFKDDDKLFFTSTYRTYCIDLTTGLTAWKYYATDRSRRDVNSGIDNYYITSGSNYNSRYDNERLYLGNILTNEEDKLLLTPDYTPVVPPVDGGIVTYIKPFKKNGNIYIAFGTENPYRDFTPMGWGFSELNLYNLTNANYEYKKLVINPNLETRVVGNLIYSDPNLYFESTKYIHCHDAMTGKQLWKTYLGNSNFTFNLLLADNKLFTACEDRMLYCLNASTGTVLWKTQNTGTCSEISYLNGVIYYVGGGDGLLHSVDAQTGTHLWKLKSPDDGVLSGGWFQNLCIVVPGQNGEKGKVIVSTGYNAYAYEAAR